VAHVLPEGLVWVEAPMPDSSGPVQIARLPDAGDGSFRAYVKFPAGWERVVAGSYPVEEVIEVVAGELWLDGVVSRPGDARVVGAGVVRAHTRTPSGCVALARFAGSPRWTRAPIA
jgi:hypothetical protein